jgi:LAO/AO transport system kinase
MRGRIVPLGWTSVNAAVAGIVRRCEDRAVADLRLQDLARRLLDGDRTALARLITRVEARDAALPEVMAALYERTGGAHVVGVTGPPGAGKSTLTDGLITLYRAAGKRVGVVAVDPSSPFSGGAVLGDRIRMQRHFLDDGVFIRSLATRGSHGGLPRAARDVVRLLEAFGSEVVLVETVGVGQTELDVMRLADSVVVVLVPEAGDAVQVMKAGLLEIADVFVVNKADREGADRMAAELTQMLHLREPSAWDVPVVKTEAVRGTGIDLVADALARHRAQVVADRRTDARSVADRRARELVDILDEELRRRVQRGLDVEANGLGPLVASVRDGSVDPYSAAVRILGDERALAHLVRERPR